MAVTECTGRPLLEVARQPDLVTAVQRAVREGEVVRIEIEFGAVRPGNFNITAARIDAGAAPGAVLVLYDVSEIRRLERVRRDFVANVSHELRTPLTAVQGFAETLLSGALEDPNASRRFLEIIREHAARLGRLTDDLLKLSAIEAGKLTLQTRAVSVANLFEVCLETARHLAAGKKLELCAEDTSGVPPMRGDLMRLQEVLQNLLDNAVQYTPPGGRITLRAWRENCDVVMCVEDTGIGIPHAEQERIFERFYRVDAARSREAGGTGLGLSIARHIIEAHGGRIWVESEVGHGSRFFVAIPGWEG
jgi:two-component system phosphate regulon sensor histidine kinase PhoR